MDTRKEDILQLLEHRDKARNLFERDMIDRTLYRIRSESPMVEDYRKKLIMAIRNDDRRAVERFRHELLMIRADETHGHDY